MVISSLAENNKSKPAAPRKSNSHKANPNRRRKRPGLELVADTLTENSNSEPVIYKKWLVKGRHNPSPNEPILASNSSTREITADNSKLL